MVSDEALRKRRYRAHQADDHRLCDPSKCTKAVVPGAPQGTTLTAAVEQVVVPLSAMFGEEDPRRALCALATLVARQLDEQMNANLARELRTLLLNLLEYPAEPATFVDEIQLRSWRSKVDLLFRGAR